MIEKTILSTLIILLVLFLWVGVQHLSRRVAARHPEFGPAREEGTGCGKSCGCTMAERKACAHQGADT